MIDNYVNQALVGLETWLKGQTISVSPQNAIETYVFAMIQKDLPLVASFLGPDLQGLISAAVAKVMPAITAAVAVATAPEAVQPIPGGAKSIV